MQAREQPYGVFMAVYVLLWVLFFLAVLVFRVPWPPTIGWLELFLLSLATFRFTSIVTEEKVARALRAPFCEQIQVEGPNGEPRSEEVPRGRGLRRVAGELLLCPWCAGVWVATLLTFLYVLMPALGGMIILVFGVAALGLLLEIVVKLLDRTRTSLPEP